MVIEAIKICIPNDKITKKAKMTLELKKKEKKKKKILFINITINTHIQHKTKIIYLL